jgi:hypothetical protein
MSVLGKLEGNRSIKKGVERVFPPAQRRNGLTNLLLLPFTLRFLQLIFNIYLIGSQSSI